MPVLSDPRREAFARFVAEGRSKRDAALAIGYSAKSASSLGSRLFKQAAIQERIAELQQQAAALSIERAQITRERVLDEYARLAFLDIRKAFTPDGALLSITDMDDDTARAIAGLEFEEVFEGRGEERVHTGRIHKLKFVDKKGALDSIAKHLGMFVDRKEIRFPKLSEATDDELRALLSELGDEAAADAGDPAGAGPEETPA